jgi:hypothetical protein
MNPDWQKLIDRYLDDELSQAELLSFQEWLAADPSHMQQFVEAAMLHDRLHGMMLARTAIHSVAHEGVGRDDDHADEHESGSESINEATAKVKKLAKSNRSLPRRLAVLFAVATSLLFGIVLWRGGAPAFAAQSELQKVIAAQLLPRDRSYAIEVESSVIGGAKQKSRPASEVRPPKPPLNGARLFVRGKSMFVLMRTLSTGEPFITGCDGQVSWSVPPGGAVRVSPNLQEFSRDVPGHEYSMSLCNLTDALAQLNSAYEINLLPVEYDDPTAETRTESTRLLVATKRSGYRGPRRVEITYTQESRLIEQIRFIDMPYGSDRLTIRMSLAAQNNLADDFFLHESHHADDRRIIQE